MNQQTSQDQQNLHYLFNWKNELEKYVQYLGEYPDAKPFVERNVKRLKDLKIGDDYKVNYNHGPFMGFSSYKISAIQEDGTVFGTMIESSFQEMDINDVY